MGVDLGLNIGDRYTIVLVLFFPTYALLELPSNIILRKVGSANWLAFIAFSWGAVMIGQGFVESWITLAICRVLLGTYTLFIFAFVFPRQRALACFETSIFLNSLSQNHPANEIQEHLRRASSASYTLVYSRTVS